MKHIKKFNQEHLKEHFKIDRSKPDVNESEYKKITSKDLNEHWKLDYQIKEFIKYYLKENYEEYQKHFPSVDLNNLRSYSLYFFPHEGDITIDINDDSYGISLDEFVEFQNNYKF